MVTKYWIVFVAWLSGLFTMICFFSAGYYAATKHGFETALWLLIGIILIICFFYVSADVVGRGRPKPVSFLRNGAVYAVIGDPIKKQDKYFLVLADEDSPRGNVFLVDCEKEFPSDQKIVKVADDKLIPFSSQT